MWFDIIKRFPTAFKELGGMAYGFVGDWLVVFTRHYMETLDDPNRKIRYHTITPTDIEKLFIPLIPKEGPNKTYWFYLNDDAKDFAYSIVDVYYSPDDVIKGTNRKVRDFKDEQGEHRNKAIVFHHINGHDRETNKPHNYNAEYKLLQPYYRKGIKRGHREKRKSREKRRPKTPKDIFPK
jgi:hypothetical protein